MKGSNASISTIKGQLLLIADNDIVRISTSPIVLISWEQAVELRNRLTKMIDNKRARERLKYK